MKLTRDTMFDFLGAINDFKRNYIVYCGQKYIIE